MFEELTLISTIGNYHHCEEVISFERGVSQMMDNDPLPPNSKRKLSVEEEAELAELRAKRKRQKKQHSLV